MFRDCIICVSKTKALISFAVTAKLICVFVFAYATSSPKRNDRSPESKQVFLNSSLVSKYFFNWSRAANSAVHGRPNSEFNQGS